MDKRGAAKISTRGRSPRRDPAPMADCIPCHFEFEEEHVVPHLPPPVRAWLLADHARLKAAGYPAAQVLEHAEREMVYFRRYNVPRHLIAQVEADHEKFHPSLTAQIRHRPPSLAHRAYELAKHLLF